ncbi:MAG: phosphoenolpyruvate--protein phosphotransferase [Lachnospiraceae bacterium]|nr:phosphoenolpyruvate--protein phosphotransferase [Lachnospiraceae bacterium]
MERYDCKTAQTGFCAGYAFVFKKEKTIRYERGDKEEEENRLNRAVLTLGKRLEERRDSSDNTEAELIDAELMILNDESFTGTVSSLIKNEGADAPGALERAEAILCGRLAAAENDYIKERSEDIKGLISSLAAIITGNETASPEKPCILAGEELSISDLAAFDHGLIKGIITNTGSPTSHLSVLAGNLGVPYLFGLDSITEVIHTGDYLVVDGGKASVLINPEETVKKEAERKQEENEKARAERRKQAETEKTKTGIYANITGTEEAEAAERARCDGIGLVRSEFLFLNRKNPPAEEEQFEAYKHIVEAVKGKEVIIRTMDIGSDKSPEWLTIPDEINPALGQRGIRVSLNNRELFRTQLRAILRAAVYGNLKLMLPMVTALWEVDEAISELKQSAEELKEKGESYCMPETGVMIETPAAVMIAAELASKVRFFSIGTNDLAQYALAIDREAKGLDDYFDPLHEGLFRMIGMTVEAAHAHDIPVAVCGELASRPDAVEKLIRFGVDELSVSVSKLYEVREAVAEIESSFPTDNSLI